MSETPVTAKTEKERLTELWSKGIAAVLLLVLVLIALVAIGFLGLAGMQLTAAVEVISQAMWLIAALAGLYGGQRGALKLAEVIKGKRGSAAPPGAAP